jgi:CubicO group peptidase (beta-lactamase class C family)
VVEAERAAPGWRKTTAREMRASQTGTLRPRFGLGWQREPGAFGRTCSAETFGHFGSTGTLIWHDPAMTCVVLTTRPATGSRFSLLLPVSEIMGRTSG